MKNKEKKNKKGIFIIVTLSIILTVSIIFNIFLFNKKNIIEYKNDENIIFFGDSITEGYRLDKYFPKKNVVNKGISGNRTTDLVNRIDKDVYEYNPSKTLILIGINDLAMETEKEDILENIQLIINGLQINRKNSEIYVESVYPVNKDLIIEKNTSFAYTLDNVKVMNLNNDLKKMCEENDITYIDVYSKLIDDNNNLKSNYTYDGVHLTDLGYLKITSVLKDYVK